jgi:hypothetical protein
VAGESSVGRISPPPRSSHSRGPGPGLACACPAPESPTAGRILHYPSGVRSPPPLPSFSRVLADRPLSSGPPARPPRGKESAMATRRLGVGPPLALRTRRDGAGRIRRPDFGSGVGRMGGATSWTLILECVLRYRRGQRFNSGRWIRGTCGNRRHNTALAGRRRGNCRQG